MLLGKAFDDACRSARIVGSLNAMASCLPLLVLFLVCIPLLTTPPDGRGHASTPTGVFGVVPHELLHPRRTPTILRWRIPRCADNRHHGRADCWLVAADVGDGSFEPL